MLSATVIWLIRVMAMTAAAQLLPPGSMAQELGGRPGIPIIIEAEPDLDACYSNGVVEGLDPAGDGFLAVRGGPGTQYPQLDRLYNGVEVHICNRRGDWLGIVYTNAQQDCNVSTPWFFQLVLLYAIRLPANKVLQESIAHLLTRPVGRPPNHVRRYYASFSYQAGSWDRKRRVVAKVEWHPGELYPRVGFIVTNLRRPAERVVAFYNQRGTAEQWIKEGKNAIKWTRLSCRRFRHNAVRLQLHALAYNLANFMRTLALPKEVEHWSLTTIREKLVKIGAKVVAHGRYVTFQMAEVAVPRDLFRDILRRIDQLRRPVRQWPERREKRGRAGDRCVRMRQNRPGIGRRTRPVRPIRRCSGSRTVHGSPIRPVRLSSGQMLGVIWGMSRSDRRPLHIRILGYCVPAAVLCDHSLSAI
jgi:hypothetical protein